MVKLINNGGGGCRLFAVMTTTVLAAAAVLVMLAPPVDCARVLLENVDHDEMQPLVIGRSDNSDDDDDDEKYAVIFDGGSTGSRVHAFRFDQSFTLLPISDGQVDDFELYVATKPGLSSYADDPNAAAQSLKSLLDQAEAIVPQHLRSQTPLALGATAGLRQLSGDTSERILQAVRELFEGESKLKYKAEWVSILDGFQEGSYMWIAVNYLLGKLGQEYSLTVGVVDLGGGSVQMAYAISDETKSKAPVNEDHIEYVQETHFKEAKYNLYAHSYLNYGLNAARAEILKLTAAGKRGNPCVIDGYRGEYEYSGEVYKVWAPPSGASVAKCRAVTRRALKLDADCPYTNCTFNGIWNGGRGDGLNNLFIASFFYDTAAWADIVEQSTTSAKMRPTAYLKAARTACGTNVKKIKEKYPHVEDRNMPFLCMDLIYMYTLLVEGFGIDGMKEVTVVQQIDYKGSMIGAAWPLGRAVDLLSPAPGPLNIHPIV